MKVMVTGSRTWGACPHEPKHEDADGLVFRSDCPVTREHRRIMLAALREHCLVNGRVELIHGDAVGADRMAASIWGYYGLGPVTAFPANWDLGKGGGAARNGVLVAHMPDLVLAFHLDNSLGTADAIAQARKAGLKVEIYPKET